MCADPQMRSYSERRSLHCASLLPVSHLLSKRPLCLHMIVCNLVAIAFDMLAYPPPSPYLHLCFSNCLYFILQSLCWSAHTAIKMASTGRPHYNCSSSD